MLVLLLALQGGVARGQQRVSDTPHNLSSSGPGQVRALTESAVCIFCHAAHSTGGMKPLWNRDLPVSSYSIYASSTLDANPGQPTGASKLCLSCHDGTIALGNVLSRADRIRMVGGDFMPAGLANLGTDLSDDHPISFTYGTGLAAADRQLLSPNSLPEGINLDASGQLQCTACHDPHDNQYGNFLVTAGSHGVLCTACHSMNGWSAASHRVSTASVTGSQAGDWPWQTVAANACRSCHRPHGAGGKFRLLIFEAEEENCLSCHDGTVASKNMRAELDKPSGHDPRIYLEIHDPVEGTVSGTPHIECMDCHNPHAVQPVGSTTTYVAIGPTMYDVAGTTAGGGVTETAQAEYEVCFRCHGDSATPTQQSISRQAQSVNMRLKFSPTNPSYHPVITSVASPDVVSLVPGLTNGMLIRCTDCHNNDSGPRAGGTGPDGPHGSIHDFLLERNYTVQDDVTESQYDYDLCYKCHRRASILSDESFKLHRKHIVKERAPCSACHDPHGISTTQGFESDHTHLINFDTRIVFPTSDTQQMYFRDTGQFSGSCTLTCHGEKHRDESYGGGGGHRPQGKARPNTKRIRRIR